MQHQHYAYRELQHRWKCEYSPYKALDTGKASGIFVMNTREDGSGTHDEYIGNVNYGRGHLDAQKWWGEQYRDLLD